jgi:hypothetical protein
MFVEVVDIMCRSYSSPAQNVVLHHAGTGDIAGNMGFLGKVHYVFHSLNVDPKVPTGVF